MHKQEWVGERERGTSGKKVIGDLRPQSLAGERGGGKRERTTEHGEERGEVGEQDRVDGGGSGEEARSQNPRWSVPHLLP